MLFDQKFWASMTNSHGYSPDYHGWPGKINVVTVVIGLSYGAQWSILLASVSELFGLRSFGAFYNFITLANPAGSLIFSQLIASRIYDYYAEKQAALTHTFN